MSADNNPANPAKAPAKKRRRLGCLMVLALALVGLFFALPGIVDRVANRTRDPGPYAVSAAARKLHEGLFVADLHADSLLWDRELSKRGRHGHVDLPRMREGGLDLQTFTIVTKVPNWPGLEGQRPPMDLAVKALAMSQGWPAETWSDLEARALYQVRRLKALERGSQGGFRVITGKVGLRAFLKDRQANKELRAGLLGIEGAHCLDELAAFDRVARAGVQIVGLVHMFDNRWAASAHGVSKAGLTDEGAEAVRRMEGLGLIIDLAHSSEETIDEVLAIASRPVLVSHTGLRGHHASPRNLSDRQAKAIAAAGGLIGVGFWPEAAGGDRLADVVGALKYGIGLVGVDRVALGSDFDGAVPSPINCAGLPKLTEALLSAGLSPEDIGKVMGENLRRFLLENLKD